MAEFAVKIKGMDELLKKVAFLPKKMRGSALKDAANAAGTVYRDAARRHAPQGRSGKLRRDIQHKVTKRGTDDITVGVSWRIGRGSRTSAFYGLFFHGKAQNRQRKGKGKRPTFGSTGSMPTTNRFLDRAFDENTDRADRAFAISLRRSLLKEARRG